MHQHVLRVSFKCSPKDNGVKYTVRLPPPLLLPTAGKNTQRQIAMDWLFSQQRIHSQYYSTAFHIWKNCWRFFISSQGGGGRWLI